MLSIYFPAILELSWGFITGPFSCTPYDLAMWTSSVKRTGPWTAWVCQGAACVRPLILDEHKVHCSHPLLLSQKKWRLEIIFCAGNNSRLIWGHRRFLGAYLENPVDIIQYNRAKTSESTLKLSHLEAAGFPLSEMLGRLFPGGNEWTYFVLPPIRRRFWLQGMDCLMQLFISPWQRNTSTLTSCWKTHSL